MQEAGGGIGERLARLEERVRNLTEDIHELRESVHEHRDETRSVLRTRQVSRTQIIIALIGASAIVVASLVTAIVAITGHG